MNLIEALQTVPDYRQARGKRHPLWIILVFIVMGNLAGYPGNRPLRGVGATLRFRNRSLIAD
jgi:hypothetical protein